MPNPTALAFGYPRSKVAETDRWLVLVRPKQPTFGSLVLVCKEPAHAFSELSPEAFADMQTAIAGIERVLKAKVAYEKINYLMLMMVDRDVHFHVLPRYEGAREHEGLSFPDAGWPAAPALGTAVALDDDAVARLAQDLAEAWVAA
ncbi:HIT family protein [Caulobacter sp. D4A]|uniref:HIT family protein n=1 Tax=unclassified Caulobacter TaxID=2648921 RepID=UPI000D72FCDE|nr:MULTISPECIES: HIT family protein [unclassified Caulobacter]PXA93188.1 HIT family protein [Caulobacter sp. D5]PXA93668.1 HIT family protein [Caulobacter sp. D4A]